MQQIAVYFTKMKCVHCVLNKHNQSPAICRQIIRVDIEEEYICDNIIYHYPDIRKCFSVNAMLKI